MGIFIIINIYFITLTSNYICFICSQFLSHFIVTEEEIAHGLLQIRCPEEHCLCYVRELHDIRTHLDDPAARQYIDVKPESSEVDQEAQDLLNTLKWKKVPQKLPSSNMRNYSVPWKKGGVDPSDCEHSVYLSSFCKQVQEDIQCLVDRAFECRHERAVDSKELQQEVYHHAFFCLSKCKSFCGRENELAHIRSYLLGKASRPFVLYGPSGSGKTSIMAKVASLHCSWLGESSVSVIRFLGTSPTSTSICDTIASICFQLCTVYSIDSSSLESMGPPEIFHYFHSMIQDILPRRVASPLLILFDSVDQLSAADGAHTMNWLPKYLPSNIRIIVSVLTNEHNCLDTLKLVIPHEECFLQLRAMPLKTGMEILSVWFAQNGRTLIPEQFKLVLDVFSKYSQPLFLRLLFHQAIQWKSYTDCSGVSLPESTTAALIEFFENLESSHGMIFVRRALGYLTASRNGLSETELEDVLSLDDAVLNSVYQYWDPPSNELIRLPSLLWSRIHYFISDYLVERQTGGRKVLNWFHRQFIEAARQRYLRSPEDKKACHEGLASFFSGKWSGSQIKPITLSSRNLSLPRATRNVAPQPNQFSDDIFNIRKFDELPYHSIFCDTASHLKASIFCDFTWILNKLLAMTFQNLMQDYSLLLSLVHDKEVSIIQDTLLLSAHSLKIYPLSLAEQFLGRLNDLQNDVFPHISAMLTEARQWIHNSSSYLFLPLNQSLISPGGPLITTLSGHPSLIHSVCSSKKHSLLVSCSRGTRESSVLNVWDVESLECVQVTHSLSISGKSSVMFHSICNDYLIGACGSKVVQWNIVTGEEVGIFQTPEDISCLAANENACFTVTGLVSGDIYVISVPNATVLHTVKGLFQTGVHLLSFTNAKEWLLVVPVDGTPQVFDGQTVALHSTIKHNVKDVTCVISGEGCELGSFFFVLGFKDADISVWLFPQLSKIFTLKGHTQSIQCMVLTSLGQGRPTLVSGSFDGLARLWCLRTGICNLVFTGHSSVIWCISPIVDGFFVTGSKDDTLKVWEICSGKCIQTLEGHSSWISCVDLVVVNNEVIVLSGSNDKTVKLWKLPSECSSQLSKGDQHTKQPGCIVTTPFRMVVSGAEDALKVWDFETGRCLFTFPNPVSTVCFGKPNLLFSGDDNCILFLWDLSKLKCNSMTYVKKITVHTVITKLCCSDSDYVISGHKCGMIQVWSIDLHLLATCEGHTKAVRCTTFSKNGLLLASGSADSTVCVWKLPVLDSSSPKPVAKLVGHKKTVGCVTIVNDSSKVISGSDDCTVRIWCISSETCLNLISYTDSIKCLIPTTTALGDKLIASAHCAREQLRLWDVRTGNLDLDFCGHTHAVMSLLLINNDELLLSGSRDGTIRLWKVDTGHMLAMFDLQSQVKYMSVQGNGQEYYLATTMKTGPIALFRIHFPR